MAVLGGPVAIKSLFALLIATGVIVPVLTAVRLVIIIRSARARKDRVGGGFVATWIGEGFLVGVAIFNTVQTVLWLYNCVGELREGGDGMLAVDVWWLQRVFYASVFYVAQHWALKGAFLSLYYDLIPTLNWKSRWLLYATTGLTAVSFQGVVAAQVLYCRPVSTNWSTSTDFCSHITSKNWIMASSWANIATDLLISAIPLCIISTLQLSSRERYGFIFIYALGSLSILASILRFAVLNRDANTSYSPTPSTPTPLTHAWKSNLHGVILWSTIELLSAHICFCIPAFRVFMRRKRRASASESERCTESRNTMRSTHTPVPGTLGPNRGGDWFDYSAISPLESSPSTPLTAQGGIREDRRSWGMGRPWEVGGMEERLGDRGSRGSAGSGSRGSPGGGRAWGTFEEIRTGENRKGKGWMSVPGDERTSTEGRALTVLPEERHSGEV